MYQLVLHDRRERIERYRMAQHALGSREVMQLVGEQFAIPLERAGIARRQLDRAAELALGAVDVVILLKELGGVARVRFAKLRRQSQRALDVGPDARFFVGG